MESAMICTMNEMWSNNMPEGLDLEISHHPLTMKHVANIIIALERLKGDKTDNVMGTDFRDENLLNVMLEKIVEEKTVFERSSSPPAQFSRTGEYECTMTDIQKRSLILVPTSMELHAVMLQGGSENRTVHLNMATYVKNKPSAGARPVALGIKNTNLYLSCHKEGTTPTLHLEAVKEKDVLSNIREEDELSRFLFYKQDNGLTNSTFMSARFRDWYISTAKNDNRPVEMCEASADRYKDFTVLSQN